MGDKMYLPPSVVYVLKTLNSLGYEAYVVGGAVRDYLMGVEPHDYDVTTSAFPDEVKEIFPSHFALGEKFGTISVVYKDYDPIEVTTFRKESNYTDGRHPDEVSFVRSVFEDLSRRDLTINAIAYNPSVGLVDPFNGAEDIKNKIIRCVNKPEDRFNEDGLRILRAMRFASRLGFTIDDETMMAMTTCIDMLDCVSPERIGSEFAKLLVGANAGAIIRACPVQISKIVPQWAKVIGCGQKNPWHIYDVETHILRVVDNVEKDEITRMAAFFHDIGKPVVKVFGTDGIDHFPNHAAVSAEIAKEVLTALRFPSKTIEDVSALVRYHDSFWNPSKKSVKKILNILGMELFEKLLDVRNADIKAQVPREDTEVEQLRAFAKEIVETNCAISVKDLAVNGNDIMKALKIPPSPTVGRVLNSLLELVLDESVENSKAALIAEAKRMA